MLLKCYLIHISIIIQTANTLYIYYIFLLRFCPHLEYVYLYRIYYYVNYFHLHFHYD